MPRLKKKPHPYQFFSATADIAVLKKEKGSLYILLIQRKYPPYQNCWALPGGFIDKEEDALTAAKRELEEETGLRCKKLTEFGAFSAPDRDPRGRTITVAYYTFLTKSAGQPKAGSDAKSYKWWPVRRLPPLAFDHRLVIRRCLSALKG